MKIGIIGVGNIGKIILQRLKRARNMDIEEILIHSRTISKIVNLEGGKVKITSSNAELAEKADVVFLCVKPQDANVMFKQLEGVDMEEKVVVSTMVGIKTEYIQKRLLTPLVARIMPNVPSMIGRGIIPVSFSEVLKDSPSTKEMVLKILSTLGKVVEIEEKHMAAVTALSGSGPAFVFVLIEALIDAGLRLGLSYDLSRELVIETLKGSAELLQRKGNHPGEFRHLVTSPAGTTIEGIYSMEREGIRGILMKAISDTFRRARYFEEGENI